MLDLYDDSLQEVLPASGEHWAQVIGEMRWQSVKASPKNEETSIKCFQRCLAMNDLDHARQVSLGVPLVFDAACSRPILLNQPLKY